MTLLNPKEYDKVVVWNFNQSYEYGVRRIILASCKEGGAVCVAKEDATKFLDGLSFRTEIWDNWTEIETKLVAFDSYEEMEHLENCWFRSKLLFEPCDSLSDKLPCFKMSGEVKYSDEDRTIIVDEPTKTILAAAKTDQLARRLMFEALEVFEHNRWIPIGKLVPIDEDDEDGDR